jgi:hypothetical protein
MQTTETLRKRGELNAYLIDPAWKGRFPSLLPKNQWPVLDHLFQKKNQITTAGQLYSYQHGFNFAFIAGGTGTNTPTPSDGFLQAEQQRFEIFDVVFTPGEINAFAEIPPSTGNLTWQEWGVFLDDATNAAGSGTMYSRLLQTFTKTLGTSVLLTYTLKETL